YVVCFFFSSRRRHTRSYGDWSSDVCSSDLQRLRLVEMSMVGLSSLKPAFTRSAGTLPSVSTKRSTSKYFLSSHRPKMPICEKSRSEERRVGKECRCRRAAERCREQQGRQSC